MSTNPAAQHIHRAGGVTDAERYLKRLCEMTFLRLWSYPDLYADKGPGGKPVDRKELCDMLVVFDRHVVIFSDKAWAYQACADPSVAWRRWHKAAVLAGARQTHGAERHLRMYPNRVFLDPACTRPFPYVIPIGLDVTYHRIVVAHGTSEECRSKWGGSGSLKLVPSLGRSAMTPFVVGDLDPNVGYVHILDDTTLDIMMHECNTIRDFTTYLLRKEAFVRSGRLTGASGEEDLLALYLTSDDKGSGHGFDFPDTMGNIVVDHGPYAQFIHSPQYAAKKSADAISDAWDKLIEHFSQNLFSGAQIARPQAVLATEKVLRILASENRTERRALGQQLVDFIHQRRGKDFQCAMRVIQPAAGSGPDYVLAMVLKTPFESDDQYRLRRAGLVRDYSRVWRLTQPNATAIVGIALRPQDSSGPGDDLFLYDGSAFDARERAAAIQLQAQHGWLRDRATWSRMEVREYPAIGAGGELVATNVDPYSGPASRRGRSYAVGRNDRCPCKSGLKYKRCCGR